MPKFNAQQQRAIDVGKDINVIISAGAGSGKTFTLSYKVFTLVTKENIDPSRLLVLTFTNKAAHEMKERIIDLFKTNNCDDNLKDEILSSHIQTFDSFSLYLVKKYARFLNLPKNITIADDSILKAKVSEYTQEVLDDCYVNEKSRMIKTLGTIDCLRDDNFIKIINDINGRMNDLSDETKDAFFNKYEKTFLSSHFLTSTYHSYLARVREQILTYIKIIYLLLERVPNDLDDKSVDIYSILEKYKAEDALDNVDFYAAVGESLSKEDFHLTDENFAEYLIYQLRELYLTSDEDFYDKLTFLTDDSFVESIRSIKVARGSNLSVIKKTYTVINNYLKSVLPFCDFDKQEQQISDRADDVKLILEIVKKVDDKLTDFKRINNFFTFNDITKLVIKMITLPEYGEIKKEIVSRFDYILVDEYQDTNDTQEQFLETLSQHATIFTVGDAKQSIYGFRNSNLQLFLNRRENYRSAHDPHKEVLEMSTNYRSVKAILNDINTIFENYMSKGHGGLDYVDIERLHYDDTTDLFNESKLSKEGEYGINILRNYRLFNERITSQDHVRSECLEIISDILNKIRNHYQVLGKDQILRDCRFSDFAIIIRKKRNFSVYKDLFTQYGLPLNMTEKTHLKDRDPILLLQSLLKLYVQLKNKDKSDNLLHLFMSIARSYIYGVEKGYADEKIYDLVKEGKKAIHNTDIIKDMYSFIASSEHLSASDVFVKMLKDFKIVEKLDSVGDISTLIAKIESFYSILVSQENIGEGIDDFTRLFKTFDRFGVALEDETNYEIENAVSLESIHSSKGLEYPIVYMPIAGNCIGGGQDGRTKPKYNFSKKYGILLPDYRLNHVPHTYLDQLFKEVEGDPEENINEHVRLFYVALTRAKESLYLVGTLPKKPGKENLFTMLDYSPNQVKIADPYLTAYQSIIPQKDLVFYKKASQAYANSADAKKKLLLTLSASDRNALSYLYDVLIGTTLEDDFDESTMSILQTIYSHLISTIDREKASRLFAAFFYKDDVKSYNDFVSKYSSRFNSIQDLKDTIDSFIINLKKKSLKATDFGYSSDSATMKTHFLEDIITPLAYVFDGIKDDFIYTDYYKFRQKFYDTDFNILPYQTDMIKEPSLDVSDDTIPYKPVKERKRASKAIVSEDATDEVLKLGTQYHKIMELLDLKHPALSFIKDKRAERVISKVLSLPIFKDLDDTDIYQEYSYFDVDNQTEGSIDLLLVKKDEILIVDYKLKEVVDEAYKGQLSTYKKNVERLFGNRRKISCYLLSLYDAKLVSVITD